MADQTIHTQPTERTLTVWTPPLLRVARAQAQAGNLRLAADFVDDELFGDDKIPSVIETLIQTLFGLVPTFEKASQGHGRLRNTALKAIEAGEDWWDLAPEPEAARIVAWGLMLGISFGEFDAWETVRGRRIPRRRRGRNVPQLKWWHPRYFRFDVPSGRWFVRTVEGEVCLDDEPDRWVIFAPYGTKEPWSLGLWRRLGRPYLLKAFGIEDLGRHGEKGASLSVEASENATREQRLEVAKDLDARGTDATIVLPAGYKLNLVEVSGEATKLYEAEIDVSDNAAGVAILGHNLTSQVDGGSHAAATIGDGIRIDRLKFVSEAWSTCAHDQICRPYAALNWGDPDIAPWPVYPVEPDEDLKAKADGMAAVVDAAAKAKEIEPRVDIATMLEQAGFPLLPQAEDDGGGLQSKQVYQYHLTYGVLTLNELRATLGLPPVKGGDVPPKPVAGSPGANDNAAPASANDAAP